MKIKDYQKKLDKRIREVTFRNAQIKECVADTHSNYVNRIFVNGRRANLTKIGNYSKGYKKTRQKRGRRVDTVNFTFEGRLFSNVANSLRVVSDKVMVNGATTKFEADKIGWLSDRFGEDVWKLDKIGLRKLGKCLGSKLVKIMTR